ncbi:MAG: hypothetical protein ACFE8L_11660 [Candidatus Hodarchaeota archaeon]
MFRVSREILEREKIRIIIDHKDNITSERIEIKDGNYWIPIIGSNDGFSTLNIWTKDIAHSQSLSYRKRTKKKLYYELDNEDFLLNLDYCLEENDIIHIRYKMSNKKRQSISKILVNYAILLENNPDFTWTPHLSPGENYVIGDHVYRSPVIIYKKEKYAFAFIPDLKTLGRNRPFQTFIDFNLKSRDFEEIPRLSYGFGNYKPVEHTLFKHDPYIEWNIEENTDLTFRYFLIFFIKKTESEILQFINNFLWEKFGRKLLYESLYPQVLPYERNADEGFKAIFERHKYWGTFVIDNKICGGIWQRTWAGRKKKPIEFIIPEMIEDYRRKNTAETASSDLKLHETLNDLIFDPEKVKMFDKHTRRVAFVPRAAEIWGNAWFLNIRTAYSFRYFGEVWKNDNLIEKAERILNTVLSLPRVNGVFPSVLFPASAGSNIISYINGLKGYRYSDDYHVVDSCLTMYWALKFREDFNELNLDILRRSKELVELIEKLQLENGTIPAYINFDKNEPIIKEELKNSASSGAPMMFLLEYYKNNEDERILHICEKIAQYIIKYIIPEDKWHDFEPFFSCTQLPLDTYDSYTKSHVMNALCIYWCAEGFKELFKITNNNSYLEAGERVMAVLSLFQQIWNIPYLNYNTFGGFGSQNADAEHSDARQGLFVRTYMEYYLLTGKEEYMERGIAALRASWALQLLKEYEEQCPGNIKGIDTIESVDKGSMYENYGHTGGDFRVPGQITFDWGVGTAAMATAYIKKHFGDLFIDFREKLIFGIDGLLVKNFEFNENSINIMFEQISGKTNAIIKAREAPSIPVEIILNRNSIGNFMKDELKKGLLTNI